LRADPGDSQNRRKAIKNARQKIVVKLREKNGKWRLYRVAVDGTSSLRFGSEPQTFESAAYIAKF
jgi:hypothetical protein